MYKNIEKQTALKLKELVEYQSRQAAGLCAASDSARMVIAEHISISQDIPRSFNSEISTHGHTLKYVSISFQQRSAIASR